MEDGCALWQQCGERQGYGEGKRQVSAQHCEKPLGEDGALKINSVERTRLRSLRRNTGTLQLNSAGDVKIRIKRRWDQEREEI
ncbi:hypothetical protein Y032_0038g3571 [Ancylostoma ceylanicum]|uniref:Uncharacterized protein n=1 Tax=Ancylostoma ceylanicum TaxID=53326 RepID=A0A016UKI9_9BILA|nr:hypothetical protein Y032_0038g3571 [Ancylostoma ceylanicum]